MSVRAWIAVLCAGWPAAGLAAVTTFDGTYRPPAGGAVSAGCPTPIGAPIQVKDGTARLQLTQYTFEGSVGSDGAVTMYSGKNTLVGKFIGTHFSGTLGFQRCSYDIQFDRR